MKFINRSSCLSLKEIIGFKSFIWDSEISMTECGEKLFMLNTHSMLIPTIAIIALQLLQLFMEKNSE
jgi:hypothetical protein